MRKHLHIDRLVRESGDQLDQVSLLFVDWLIQSGNWSLMSDLEVAHLPPHLFPGLINILQCAFPPVPRFNYVRPSDGHAVTKDERVDLEIEGNVCGPVAIHIRPLGVIFNKDLPAGPNHRE